jgi:penicillin amidase
MRAVRAIIPLLLTLLIVYSFNRPWENVPGVGSLPALGSLLDPVGGCWASAEPVDKDFNSELIIEGVKDSVTVWFDQDLKAHIRAKNDYDVYFAEGYVHAYFRLWQMDLQTRAAGGRVSEILGEKALEYDRIQRRKGMTYGAEQSLSAMEEEPHTRRMMDAYTAGINSYINTLSYKDLPIEYKLMDFKPEPWTNLKSALLLKYMADDLTGYTEDLQLTLLRDVLPADIFALLYAQRDLTSKPVIPAGTAFDPPLFHPVEVPGGDIWGHLTSADFEIKDDKNDGKGSNNWAVSGSRTASGAPILCNDPHLGLNLPSLWFETQLQCPGMNVYGASLPGAPGVVIGFTDSISWGFTNNYRDVKDFYTIDMVNGKTDKYMFAGRKATFNKRIEHIGIKGGTFYDDTVLYSVHGPLMYDKSFHGKEHITKPLALAWMAHRPSNELYAIYMLNRAKNYEQYVTAIMNFHSPGQNMVYADKAGNIALWGQGQFINKWKEQGRYVMNGAENSTRWGAEIPTRENPHVLNPEQGYVSSANQTVTDTTYPYWYNGYFNEFRSWRIDQQLAAKTGVTVKDMFGLQQDTHSILAENVLPVMLQNLSVKDEKYIAELKKWDHSLAANSVAASVFQVWWHYCYKNIWSDITTKVKLPLAPSAERTMQMMVASDPYLKDLSATVTKSYKETLDSLTRATATGEEWYKVKNTTITHLAKLPAFSYDGINVGGWGNVVNAVKKDHGPSWRMVVQMTAETDAYGVYPGGQSGNPGSKYYATFIDKWAKGEYNKLLFLADNDKQDNKALKYKWVIKGK